MKEDFYNYDWVEDYSIFEKGAIWDYAGYVSNDVSIPLGDGDFSGFLMKFEHNYASIGKAIKPILTPLTTFNKWIIKDIKSHLGISHNQCMELLGFMDDEIKLENISLGLYNAMCKMRIDFKNLIEKGLAIDVNKL